MLVMTTMMKIVVMVMIIMMVVMVITFMLVLMTVLHWFIDDSLTLVYDKARRLYQIKNDAGVVVVVYIVIVI